jgi:uncharacterized protein YggT (Ycf19 family)
LLPRFHAREAPGANHGGWTTILAEWLNPQIEPLRLMGLVMESLVIGAAIALVLYVAVRLVLRRVFPPDS